MTKTPGDKTLEIDKPERTADYIVRVCAAAVAALVLVTTYAAPSAAQADGEPQTECAAICVTLDAPQYLETELVNDYVTSTIAHVADDVDVKVLGVVTPPSFDFESFAHALTAQIGWTDTDGYTPEGSAVVVVDAATDSAVVLHAVTAEQQTALQTTFNAQTGPVTARLVDLIMALPDALDTKIQTGVAEPHVQERTGKEAALVVGTPNAKKETTSSAGTSTSAAPQEGSNSSAAPVPSLPVTPISANIVAVLGVLVALVSALRWFGVLDQLADATSRALPTMGISAQAHLERRIKNLRRSVLTTRTNLEQATLPVSRSAFTDLDQASSRINWSANALSNSSSDTAEVAGQLDVAQDLILAAQQDLRVPTMQHQLAA